MTAPELLEMADALEIPDPLLQKAYMNLWQLKHLLFYAHDFGHQQISLTC
jgi:hypothetical protein